MAYEAPTPTTFKARYPEFTAVSDALVQLVLNDAIGDVGDTWLEKDRARAQMLLAAHILTVEGEPGRTENGSSGATAGSGLIKRDKVGDVETEFAAPSSSGDGSSSLLAAYAQTFYGRQYLELMRRNFPAVAVV